MEPEKPTKPIYTALLICERGITDSDDHVISLIRLVDVFYVADLSPVPPEKRPIPINIYFTARFPKGDDGAHSVEFLLERPDGEILPMGHSSTEKDDERVAESAPTGINFLVKIGVFPKFLGTHYIIVRLDGTVAGRVPFTLHPKQESASEQTRR